jgi:hypothetical protein
LRATAEAAALPPDAVALLDRINRSGGLPTTDRAIGDIIREVRGRNEQEVKISRLLATR